MPIAKELTTPNGAAVTYHRAVAMTVGVADDSAVIDVASWKNEEWYSAGNSPAWHFYESITIGNITGLLLDHVEAKLTVQAGTFYGGTVVTVSMFSSVDAARLRKKAEIDQWRAEANSTLFTYSGKEISADDLGMKDLMTTNGKILRTGSLPAGFPGAWKAIDGSYVSIPNVAAFYALYDAMYDQGLANFARSQALKAYVDDSARTIPEIVSITWQSTV